MQAVKGPMTKKISLTLGLVTAAALVALIATGCTNPFQKQAEQQAGEKLAENILEKATGEKVDVNSADNSLTITSDEGTMSFGSTELPKNFPTDVPLYPQNTLTFAHVGAGEDADSASATFESDDSVDKVSEWYKSQIESNGWKIDSTDTWGSGAEKYVNYTATKGERTLSIGVSFTEKTLVTVTVYKTSAADL